MAVFPMTARSAIPLRLIRSPLFREYIPRERMIGYLAPVSIDEALPDTHGRLSESENAQHPFSSEELTPKSVGLEMLIVGVGVITGVLALSMMHKRHLKRGVPAATRELIPADEVPRHSKQRTCDEGGAVSRAICILNSACCASSLFRYSSHCP
jgi:hypothetical protein